MWPNAGTVVRTFPLLALFLLLSSCGSSTKFVATWKDPDAQPFEFTKVLALAITSDDVNRRKAEDGLSEFIRESGIECVPAYEIIPKDRTQDIEYTKRVVNEQGFDGAVTIRPVAVSEKMVTGSGRWSGVYAPDTYYYPFWGYYGTSWYNVYEPGYLKAETQVQIETNIYSVKAEKLLWSGVSETIEPSSVYTLVNQIATETVRTLRDEGLIRPR